MSLPLEYRAAIHLCILAISGFTLASWAHSAGIAEAAKDQRLHYRAADVIPLPEGVTTVDLDGDGRPDVVVRYHPSEGGSNAWRTDPIIPLLRSRVADGGAEEGWFSVPRFVGVDDLGAPLFDGFRRVSHTCTEADVRLIRRDRSPPLLVVAERVFIGPDGKFIESVNLAEPGPVEFSLYDLTPLSAIFSPRDPRIGADFPVYRLIRKFRAAGLYCSLDEAFAKELLTDGSP